MLGLAAVNGLAFGVGAVVGLLWLRVRLGPLHGRRVLGTALRSGLAALVAVAVAVLSVTILDRLLGGSGPVADAWRALLVGGAVSLAVLVAGLRLLHVTELDPLVARLRRR